MKSFVYTGWDGTQTPFTLKKKEIVDTFMENIMKGMSPNASMARMFWEGFPLAGMDFRVMGLEEMFNELQQQQYDLFTRYNLEKVFDRPIEDVKNLLTQENMTRVERDMPRSPAYDDLPAGLLEKFKSLEHFDFMDKDSADLFHAWRSRQGEIVELYEFYSRYERKFIGPEYADYNKALELMRQIREMEELQQKIRSGRVMDIDSADLMKQLGERAGQSFNILLQIPHIVSDQGMTTFDHQGAVMTPRGMRFLGELAFGKVYHQLKRDRQGDHDGNIYQTGEIEPDTSRPYEYGDRFDLDITRSILEAVSRGSRIGGRIDLSPDDFYIRERERRITSTTVMLLDLSWSMAWEGRFEAAKKVGLALDHYVRTRFPNDRFHIVGFSTLARELRGKDLALAVWDNENPFTNLQDALRLAMKLIKKSGNRNNRVIVITDGQPTAYYQGTNLHVEMPNNTLGISPSACKATLAEVRKVTAQGMHIDTFMLDTNPALVEFTRQISRINGGRAVICVPDKLGELVMVEEIKRRGRRI